MEMPSTPTVSFAVKCKFANTIILNTLLIYFHSLHVCDVILDLYNSNAEPLPIQNLSEMIHDVERQKKVVKAPL